MAANSRFRKYSVLILFITVLLNFKVYVATEEFNYIEIATVDTISNHTAPRFINSSSSIEFLSGQWVGTFECRFDSWPLPKISWHNQVGIRIENEPGVIDITTQTNGFVSTSTLTVGAFQESNASQYTCLAVNAKGFEDGVTWPDSSPVLLNNADKVVSAGDMITAKCIGYAGSNLIWKLPGSKENHLDVTYNNYNDNINSTSMITFRATETDNGSPYMCCVVLQNPQKAISPACTNFTLTIKSKPLLTFHQSCSSNNEHFPKCELMCRFTGVPVPQNVTWEYCPSLDQCSVTDLQILPIVEGTQVIAKLQLQNVQQGFYRCKAGSEEIAEHIFNITGNQIVPTLVRHNFSIGITKEDVTVNFTCIFSANPRPVIRWIRKEHLWSSGTETLTSDDVNFKITEKLITENAYQTTLLVMSYREEARSYSYYCKAENENGIAESPPLLAYIIDDVLVLNTTKSDPIYEDGEDVDVSCYYRGYPAPLINLRTVSEYDTQLTFSHEESVANVRFTARWQNSYVKVECTAVNPLQPLNSANATIIVYVEHASVITDVHNCTPEDFEVNGTCKLQCTVQKSPQSLTKYFDWLYYTNYVSNDTSSYVIVDGIEVEDITPYQSIYSLELSEYYAAFYRFYIQLFNPPDIIEELEQVFQINPEQAGTAVGDFCSNSSDCMAYNSKCENSLCQCVSPYDILLDVNSNTSACLTEAKPGTMCYNDLQCARAALNYNCTLSHMCECEGFIIHDGENDTEVQCVDPRTIGQKCTSNDQCYLADENSECESNVCQCKSGYAFTTFDYRCETEKKEMTPGEIFGIVLLGLLLIGILAYSVKRYRDNQKLKKMLEDRKNIWPETEWDSSEKDYSTFENSSLQFQESSGHIRLSSVRTGSSASGYSDVRL